MLLARRYRSLQFEELKPFPRDGLIMYAVEFMASWRESPLQLINLDFFLTLSHGSSRINYLANLCVGPCNFESGLCGWKDTSIGSYQWSRNKGSTVTPGTGPSVDHTCGNASCKLLISLLSLFSFF